jgi:hypothetical protein
LRRPFRFNPELPDRASIVGAMLVQHGGPNMATARKHETTALEELKGVRGAFLELTRTLLNVATTTLLTAADATLALTTEALRRVRKQAHKASA